MKTKDEKGKETTSCTEEFLSRKAYYKKRNKENKELNRQRLQEKKKIEKEKIEKKK